MDIRAFWKSNIKTKYSQKYKIRAEAENDGEGKDDSIRDAPRPRLAEIVDEHQRGVGPHPEKEKLSVTCY